MIIEKDTIKCEAIYNDDKTHRLYWKRVWSKDKPLACVVMLNPCISDTIISDMTTELVIKNVAKLEEYGGVIIVNLFSILTSKLDMRWARDIDLNDYENDTYIRKSAGESSVVILAWGKAGENNVRIANRAEQVIDILKPYEEKLKVITDGERIGLHPLFPAVRSYWVLIDAHEWINTKSDTVNNTKNSNNEVLPPTNEADNDK